MMIRKLITEKIIKIISSSTLATEYVGKLFVVDPQDDTFFIDWLNGGRALLSDVVFQVVDQEAYSIKQGNNTMTQNVREYVASLLVMRIYTQKGELYYPEEPNSRLYGSGPWFKKTKAEVDLLIRRIILETNGVESIRTFESEVKNGGIYTCSFELILVEGETLWQSIAI